MATIAGRMALVAAGLLLAAGAGGCADPEAEARAAAETKARHDEARRIDALRRRIAHNVECMSALRWQRASLTRSGAGDVDAYIAYFRGQLETALGDETLPGEGPRPQLTRATVPQYLEWAYPEDVRTKFRAGQDRNGDGTVTAYERSARGFLKVGACLQQASTAGVGPLARLDGTQRMFRIDDIRLRLPDKDM